MRRGMGVSRERVARAVSYAVTEFDAAAERLQREGSDYLVGGRFTAADLTFAAMAAPLLAVQSHEGYAAYVPPPELLPPEFGSLIVQLRAHEAGQHAMRCFRQHRGRRVLPGSPPLPEPPHDVLSSDEGGVGTDNGSSSGGPPTKRHGGGTPGDGLGPAVG
jgi:hypothetical protein